MTDGGAHEVDFVGNYYKPGPSSERTYALEATVSFPSACVSMCI